jgi:hypothetical protein
VAGKSAAGGVPEYDESALDELATGEPAVCEPAAGQSAVVDSSAWRVCDSRTMLESPRRVK